MRWCVYFQESLSYYDSLLLFCRFNGDIRFIVTLLAEFHFTVNQGKERMIPADANVISGIVLRAALPHDNASCLDFLSSEELDTKPFAF